MKVRTGAMCGGSTLFMGINCGCIDLCMFLDHFSRNISPFSDGVRSDVAGVSRHMFDASRKA